MSARDFDERMNLWQKWQDEKDRADAAEAENRCDVCDGRPLESGRECMCGGTGKKSAAVQYLRERVVTLEAALRERDAEIERLTREHEGWESARDGLWSVLRERNAQLERYERMLEQRKRLLWQAQGLLDCRQMPKGCPKNDPCPDCLVAADIEAHLGGEK